MGSIDQEYRGNSGAHRPGIQLRKERGERWIEEKRQIESGRLSDFNVVTIEGHKKEFWHVRG